jgi:hypothetical protein
MMLLSLRPEFRKLRFQMIADKPDSHPIVEHARPPINCGDRAYPSRRKQHQAQQAWPGRITERNR